MTAIQHIYSKIREDQRITPEEAILLLKEAPWLEIAQLAWERRKSRLGGETASYSVFRIINYTNVCSISCTFCSFKCDENESSAYVLNEADLFAKIDHGVEKGANQVFLQGGVHPSLPLSYYTNLLQAIKSKYGFHIRAFSPVELKHMAKLNRMTITKLIGILKQAGLDSVPGAGAEMLVERIRKILSPNKCTTAEWVDIMKECHHQGVFGSANIVIGSIETDEEIIEHLNQVRAIQDETGGFNSFIPWTFQPQTKDFQRHQVRHHQYLKVLGICRLFLDNIDNIEVSVLVLGREIGKLALHMGANDISSPVIEENVLRSFGVKTEKEACQLISDAGFKPVRRDFNYISSPSLFDRELQY